MKFLQKIWAVLTGDTTPRTPEDIIADMNKGAVELRARSTFDKDQIDKNVAEQAEIAAEAARKTAELDAINTGHAASAEHADRVAKRFEDLTA
ncbi:hypothetical protein VPHK567_0344 [Vibrio phage K567]|nr:hypothetical protein MYOV011v1_p0277 [Vibrio phage 6E35.1a]